jgi:hypothetical protein
MGLLSAGLLGSNAGSVDLFLPPKALVAGCTETTACQGLICRVSEMQVRTRGSVLLATVFSILVGGYLGGFQSIPINRVELQDRRIRQGQ